MNTSRLPAPFAVMAGGILVFAGTGAALGQLYDHTAHRDQTDTPSTQNVIVSELRDDADAYRYSTDPARKAALKANFCALYQHLTPNTVPNDVIYAHDTGFECGAS